MAGLRADGRALSMVLVLGAGGAAASCNCARPPLDDAAEPTTEPVCVWLAGARYTRADGSSGEMLDPVYDRSGTACLCIDRGAPYAIAEFPPELEDAFNDAALEECHRLQMTYYPEAVSDSCEELYEAGNWKNNIVRPVGSNANAKPPGFSCE